MRSALKSLSLTHLEIAMDSCEIPVTDVMQDCTRAMQLLGQSSGNEKSHFQCVSSSLPFEGCVGSRAALAKSICRRSTVNTDFRVARE